MNWRVALSFLGTILGLFVLAGLVTLGAMTFGIWVVWAFFAALIIGMTVFVGYITR